MPASTTSPSQPAVAVAAPAISEKHLEMEAPFVYEAGNPDQELNYVAARLRLTQGSSLPGATVFGPPEAKPEPAKVATATPATEAAKPKEKKGLFGKMGSFFSKIFR